MATIKDVARLAGVSVATVSRVLNGEVVVAEQTKAQVNSAITTLHYSPNLLGRNLRRLETKKILVILNTISNQFYSGVVKGIEECAGKQGYTVMVCMTHGDKKLEENFLKLLRTRLVDGAIFLTTETDGASLDEQLAGLPVVQACEPQISFHTPSVSIDNEKAAYEAACYLIEKGHRKIAYLGAEGVYPSSRLREKGYLRALLAHGIKPRADWLLSEGFSFNAGIRAAMRLLSSADADKALLPTAIFCVSDSCAAGVIKTMAEHNVRTPEDISVMGFDDTQLSQVYIPAITTTRQPRYDLGFKATELLLLLMANTSEPMDNLEQPVLLLPHEIVERESVLEIG